MSGFFKKKYGKSSTKALTPSNRADIIAYYTEDGYKPSEIADELSLDVEKVSRVIENYKRKEHTPLNSSSNDFDNVRKARDEIAALELQEKKMDIQWKIEDRKDEREAEKAEYFDKESVDSTDDPTSMMLQAFLAKMMTSPGTPTNPTEQNPMIPTSQPVGAPQQQAKAPIDLTDEEIIEIIGRYPKELKMLQKMPDSVIPKVIKSYAPQLSDETIGRAVELLKKNSIKA